MSGALVATDVDYRRGGRDVLRGLSVTVEPGDVVAILGPSGSGKSSLLGVLAGLEPPDAGTVRLGDELLRAGDVTQRRKFGLVLQGYGLLTLLTAAENVEVALQARGIAGASARLRAGDALADLGLEGVAHKLVEKLSGGQQQRVAIARALVCEPDVVLADEPTAELDHAAQDVVLDGLRAAADRGAVVVIATHDPDVAARCDRALRFRDGHLSG